MKGKENQKNELSDLVNDISPEEILANLPGHLYWKNRYGQFLGCNLQQAKDAGFNSPNELVGKTDYDMPWKTKANDIQHNDKVIMESGQAQTIEEFNYLSRKAPLRNKKGDVIGILGLAIEIDKYRESIEKDRNILEEIVAVMPGHVYWKDQDCILQGCNDQQAIDAGFKSRHEIVGKTAYDLLWQEQSEETKRNQSEVTNNIDKEIMKTGLPKIAEETVILPGGEEATFLSNKVPLHGKDNGVIGLVGISFDISERKKMEEALVKAKEKAVLASEVKTEFLYNMRHDLRTPFSGILGLAGALAKEEADLEKREDLNYIEQAAKQLLDHINEILEFIKLEEGRLPILSKQFDLHLLIKDISAMMMPPAREKKLAFDCIFDKAVPQFIVGDRVRTQRILINLLSNAFKFTQQGSVTLTVSVEKTTNREVILKFVVKDTGIGIHGDKYNIIFEQFNRLTSSYSGIYSGSGLGLRIVKQFLDEIDGEPHVKSKVGEGSEFTILIPYKLSLLDRSMEDMDDVQ